MRYIRIYTDCEWAIWPGITSRSDITVGGIRIFDSNAIIIWWDISGDISRCNRAAEISEFQIKMNPFRRIDIAIAIAVCGIINW